MRKGRESISGREAGPDWRKLTLDDHDKEAGRVRQRSPITRTEKSERRRETKNQPKGIQEVELRSYCALHLKERYSFKRNSKARTKVGMNEKRLGVKMTESGPSY